MSTDMNAAMSAKPQVPMVLVVGASGFVGRTVVLDLLRRGERVVAASRQQDHLPAGVSWVKLPDLTQPVSDWKTVLAGVDRIVYLAARVHVMNDTHPDPLAAYRAVNRDAALSLAQAAAAQGVKRFVYLSSVKVNGESSQRPLTEEDLPAPIDPYGISKLEAERELLALGQSTGLEVVILRPPLVYGPGVKANFMALAKAAGRGIPLPIGAVQNKRSMVYVENLADLIAEVLRHPGAVGQVFFATDGEDLSTAELTRHLAEAQGRTAWLPAVPVSLMGLAGQLSGRSNVVQRLTGSLQVSGAKARSRLNWTPPYPVWQALARTGRSVQPELHPGPSGPSKATSELATNSAMPVSVKSLSAKQRRYLAVRGPVERALALGMLAALSPLYGLLALFIKLDSPGPALFIQERAGQYHQPFKIYKFRTMRTDTPSLSTEEMQRSGLNPITRLGGILRRTSLDELPQLLNVAKGEMSFIGPRPALMTQTPVLTLRERAGVEKLLPGITGYAQATGRDDLADDEKVQRDEYYLKHLALSLDLKVIYLTLRSVFEGTGNK